MRRRRTGREAVSDTPTPALVLSGGGARAAYQVGILRYLGERRPDCKFPILSGVSAGAINIAHLASRTGGMGPTSAELARRWSGLETTDIFRSDPFSVASTAVRWITTLASGRRHLGPEARSLVDTRPLRRTLESLLDMSGVDENLRSGRLRAAAISATSYQTGRTVTFVHGEPDIPIWNRPQRRAVRDRLTVDHVMASSALPLLFPAEQVDAHYYGDGSIRQSAPLAPAVHMGADRILSVSARYDRSVEEAEVPAVTEGYPPPAQVLGLLFNNIFLDALDDDAERLERINELLEACGRWDRDVEDLRRIDLMVLRPSEDLGMLATEYRERLPRLVRFLVSGLEKGRHRTSDFVSYLLFEPGYLTRIMELGRKDAEDQWPRIRDFLGWDEEDCRPAADGDGPAAAPADGPDGEGGRESGAT